MNLKYDLDLALAILFSLLLIPAVIFTDWLAVRIILGVPFLLFIPGYALTASFFPDRARLDNTERIAYSIALSLVLVILDGLLLNFVWTIDIYPILITLEIITLPLLLVAWLRRRNLPEGEKMTFWPAGERAITAPVDKILMALIAVSIIGAGTAAVYAGIINSQPYSEMYLLGTQGKAADYPQNLAVGEKGQVSLVLTNHEKQSVSYVIKIIQEDGQTLVNDTEQSEIEITLENGQERSYEITFSFDTAGEGKKLEFDLYREGDREPYLVTYIRVDVTG